MALLPRKKNDLVSNPFRALEHLQREMNRLFDFSLVRQPWGESGLLEGQWAPSIDVYDAKDAVVVKAELPGLNKDEIDVSVENNNLIIKGEKKKDTETKEDNYYKSERFYGSFYRTIQLPAEVDTAKVDAKYQNGVLSLKFSKKEEAKPKQIDIKVK